MDWSPLRLKIQRDCPQCGGTSYVNDVLCNCAIKFRAYNRMTRGGFHEGTLDFITGGTYRLPMIENGSLALKDYNLSDEAKAAIVSGDINWIEKNIGKLTETQLKYLEHRLQREKW